MDAPFIIKHLGMAPHPEGGFFRETYRSSEAIAGSALAGRYNGGRSISTAIYFLLTGDTFSAFHRLRSDELWHYYSGDAVRLHMIHKDGRHEQVVVGPDLEAGQFPQAVIPAGCWFAARVEQTNGYILLGCTVAPGFDFSDFELARREELTRQFPQHQQIIQSFTRSSS